jgi:tRNA (mo5U34)-methyltransferase
MASHRIKIATLTTGRNEAMTEKEILDRVQETAWYQTYELVPGVVTKGLTPRMEVRTPYFQIPEDLSGKRVLDIGCAEGYFTFLAESRGASVVSIDSFPRRGFLVAKEILGSNAEFHHLSVYDLDPSKLGTFDIVFFLGVYYHLKNPIWALERIASVTRDYAIVESEVSPQKDPAGKAVSYFFEHEELNNDPTNWWAPNVPCLLQTIRASGFPRVELLRSDSPKRGIVHAYKGPRTANKTLAEDCFVQIDTPTADDKVKGTIQVSGWALSMLEPEGGIDRVTVYLDKLDDPAHELGTAEYGSHRPDLLSHFAHDAYADSGYQFPWDTRRTAPGKHTLHVLAEGKRGWCYRSVSVTVERPGLLRRR